MQQIGPGLPEVQAKAKQESEKAVAAAKEKGVSDADKLKAIGGGAAGRHRQKMASEYTKMQEVGGLVGRFLIAMVLAAGTLRWANVLRMFQLPGLVLTGLLFWFFLRAPNTTYFE